MKNIFTERQIRNGIAFQTQFVSMQLVREPIIIYKKWFPLPHKSTLQRWCQKVNLQEDILKTSIEFMRQAADMDSDDKIAVLSFDEMKVVETLAYDSIGDVVREQKNTFRLLWLED